MKHANSSAFVQYYYNPTTPAEMDKLVPQISITKYLDGLKPAGYEAKFILNADPYFFKNISSIIKSTPRDVLHAYFQSRLIATWGPRLHKDYRLPARAFANILAGRDPLAESERWRTCLSEIDSGLGWILSAAFVERAFSPDAKALGDRIISDIKTEFTQRLKGLEWMSPATQALAAKKVVNIIQKIGYPTASPNIVDPAVTMFMLAFFCHLLIRSGLATILQQRHNLGQLLGQWPSTQQVGPRQELERFTQTRGPSSMEHDFAYRERLL
jgi:endothelin-converting enzyme